MFDTSVEEKPTTSSVDLLSPRSTDLQRRHHIVKQKTWQPISRTAGVIGEAVLGAIVRRIRARLGERRESPTRNSLVPYPVLPGPLDPRLRRRLTYEASPSANANDSRYLQRQSSFFNILPPEIRVHIIALALAGPQVRLDLKHRRVDNWSSPVKQGIISQQVYENLMCTSGSWIAREKGRSHSLLALLLSCRRAYTEALPLLYRHTHFIIDDPSTITHLPALLPPRTHLSNLHHLDFSWFLMHCPHFSPQCMQDMCRHLYINTIWLDVWCVLARLSKTVRTLRVQIKASHGVNGERLRTWMEREEEILNIAKKMGDGQEGRGHWDQSNGMHRFDLELSWPLKRGRQEVDGPWTIVRQLDDRSRAFFWDELELA